MIASLPMYDWPEIEAETNAFWGLLAAEFKEVGFDAPEELTRTLNESDCWLSDNLLFSQTCGYPYATQLRNKVHLLGTPNYDVEGCEGPTYRSAVIVRKNANYMGMMATNSAMFTYNSEVSLSGFRCLAPMIGNPLEWFSKYFKSGGHRFSAKAVAAGDADIAAIDAVCWDLFQRIEPEAAEQLRVLTWTPPLPALPYITRPDFTDEEVDRLRKATAVAIEKAKVSAPASSLKISGISQVEDMEYAPLANL